MRYLRACHFDFRRTYWQAYHGLGRIVPAFDVAEVEDRQGRLPWQGFTWQELESYTHHHLSLTESRRQVTVRLDITCCMCRLHA